VEGLGDHVIPHFSRVTFKNRERRVIHMVPIFVALTIIGCIGVKVLGERGRQTHIAEERKMRRATWVLTEEAFLKC